MFTLKRVFILMVFFTMTVWGQTFDTNYPWLTDVREALVWNNVYNSPRTMGLSGAVSSLAKDLDASFYNPALYGAINRSRFFLNLGYYDKSKEVDYNGNSMENDVSKNAISSLGMIYSYPVYRGNASLAFGYVKLKDFDYSSEFSGYTNGVDGSQPRIWEENREDRRGGLSAFTFAGAFQYTKEVFLGASINLLAGENDYEFAIFREDPDFNYHQDEFNYERRFESDADLSGINFNLGLLYQLNSNWRLSLAFQSPSWISVDEKNKRYYSAEDDDMYYYETYGDLEEPVWLEDEFDYDVTLPMSLTLGMGFKKENLSFAVDFSFVDYTQLNYSDPPYEGFDESRVIEKIYDTGFRLKGGLEYFIPKTILVLRGGASYETVPYQMGREAYINSRNEMEFPNFDDNDEKISFSGGLGLYLDKAVLLDFAVQRDSYSYRERLLEEKTSNTTFLLGVTVRLK